jgi:hypothetical protein
MRLRGSRHIGDCRIKAQSSVALTQLILALRESHQLIRIDAPITEVKLGVVSFDKLRILSSPFKLLDILKVRVRFRYRIRRAIERSGRDWGRRGN